MHPMKILLKNLSKKPVNSRFVQAVESEETHVATFRNNLKKISDEYYKGYLKDIKPEATFLDF